MFEQTTRRRDDMGLFNNSSTLDDLGFIDEDIDFSDDGGFTFIGGADVGGVQIPDSVLIRGAEVTGEVIAHAVDNPAMAKPLGAAFGAVASVFCLLNPDD
jgi:hypothetical protein